MQIHKWKINRKNTNKLLRFVVTDLSKTIIVSLSHISQDPILNTKLVKRVKTFAKHFYTIQDNKFLIEKKI